MPLNRACLGKSYPAATTAVTAEAIALYARACNETNPRYFESGAPGGILAPPMFAVVVTWLPVLSAMTDPELRTDLIRLLHAAQDMEFFAPIRPGDTITAEARIAAIEAAPGGETLALNLTASNQHGELVNRTRFTVLIRGRREPTASVDFRTSAAVEPPESTPLARVAQTIDRDQTFRYAEASGDRNPIHVDEAVAKLAGLPGVVVHGLSTMAFTCRAVVESVCACDSMRLKRLAARFSRPVFPGDSITTTIWPAAEREGRRVYLFVTTNAEGLVVIRDGVAEIAP
jgi:acyl dehydratase